MIKLKDLENYVCDINKSLNKIRFKLGHQYDYYTIELFILDKKQKIGHVYMFNSIIFGGTKKECYNFLNSFMDILFLSKTEI